MSIYQNVTELKINKEPVFCTKLCNSEKKMVDKPGSNEKFISSFGYENQNNQTLLTAAEIKKPVA